MGGFSLGGGGGFKVQNLPLQSQLIKSRKKYLFITLLSQSLALPGRLKVAGNKENK